MKITHSYVLTPTEQGFTPNSPEWELIKSPKDKQSLALHWSNLAPQQVHLEQ